MTKKRKTEFKAEPMKIPTFTLAQILTRGEIDKVIGLYARAKPGTFNRLVVEQVIAPILPRIEKTLGQKMDASYIGYGIEYALMRAYECQYN